jgi:hypothetical protein
MSSRKSKHHSSRDEKEGKQQKQDGPIRQLLLQACKENGSGLTDKEHAQKLDAGEQQITEMRPRFCVATQSSGAATVHDRSFYQAPALHANLWHCYQKSTAASLLSSSSAVADAALPLSCPWLCM